ncbi:MAG: RnfABCDGE type electron transport complex subunit B [Actinomycetota bacterium]|nr:RnfABCDGE type electron transport complex subunit B [Actinomycetota bacterium]
MDLGLVLRAVGALCLIGIIAAGALAVASKRFHVEVDPRVERVLSVLPGANCGACGNPSCFGAAEAIVAGTAKVTVCTAGGQSVADAVADALGLDKCAMSSVASMRHCGGGHDAKRLFSYSGVRSCVAAVRVAGGDLACSFGCLGYGDCARACPFGAIVMDKRGLPVIDLSLCTGCEVCVHECPRGKSGLLVMGPMSGDIVVRCASRDKVKSRREYCSKCCIACKKCEKACPSDAIHVIDMLAVVDYGKCTGCGLCVAVCPQSCIDLSGHNAPKSAGLLDGLGSNVEGFHPLPDAEAPVS